MTGSHRLIADQWDEVTNRDPFTFVRHVRGEVFTPPAGEVERLLRIGAIKALDVAPTDDVERNGMGVPVPTSTDAADPAPVAPVKPANIAPKADWVAYAIASGVDPAEAEAMNKADLIKL